MTWTKHGNCPPSWKMCNADLVIRHHKNQPMGGGGGLGPNYCIENWPMWLKTWRKWLQRTSKSPKLPKILKVAEILKSCRATLLVVKPTHNLPLIPYPLSPHPLSFILPPTPYPSKLTRYSLSLFPYPLSFTLISHPYSSSLTNLEVSLDVGLGEG